MREIESRFEDMRCEQPGLEEVPQATQPPWDAGNGTGEPMAGVAEPTASARNTSMTEIDGDGESCVEDEDPEDEWEDIGPGEDDYFEESESDNDADGNEIGQASVTELSLSACLFGGSGGARRAASYGKKVMIVESTPHYGGTCVNDAPQEKLMWHAADLADGLRHTAGYKFQGLGQPKFDWATFKFQRDAYTQKLHGIYKTYHGPALLLLQMTPLVQSSPFVLILWGLLGPRQLYNLTLNPITGSNFPVPILSPVPFAVTPALTPAQSFTTIISSPFTSTPLDPSLNIPPTSSGDLLQPNQLSNLPPQNGDPSWPSALSPESKVSLPKEAKRYMATIGKSPTPSPLISSFKSKPVDISRREVAPALESGQQLEC
ncbi:hypothetical protein BDM02DRAFT_3189450 [Thelephora ganbajun]|uniref:Uncharacterized protein n=1 Tax=Thelephora ganbajun TaxID=370292 RepID=A0ACB6Z8B5_THEGA|nr:hypothetical protein BDM02DRAFT_3189450 [Thelephora ganbajun]